MITIKDITSPEYKDEVKIMYEDYYEQILGKDWISKIPIKAIRETFDHNKNLAEMATEDLYGDKTPEHIRERMALGVFTDASLIGFACIAVFNDNSGGIYNIYIKPEYRKNFIKGMKDDKAAVDYLMDSIDEYFITREVDKVVLEVPHTVSYLNNMVMRQGFQPTKNHSNAVEFHRPQKL